jgi:chorismate synthase
VASNTFGKLLAVTTFGESHGPAIGCVVDGCPPGLALAPADFTHDLARRATGKTRHTSARREADEVEILSGVFEGQTTGTPIALLIRNTDARSKDYTSIAAQFRPGHADYTYWQKYGIRDPRGGGRSSARETTMRVAAAVIAKKWLLQRHGVEVRGYLAQIGDLVQAIAADAIDWADVEANPFFWPDAAQVPTLERYMDALRKSGDSVGARVDVIATGVPPGWGEPIYGKLDGELAAALMSINAVKGVEIGAGFAAVAQKGSEHRDPMTPQGFLSNHAGGVLGGISTGQALHCSTAFKPTSSLRLPIEGLDTQGRVVDVVTTGRHDPCVGIRATPICEAMVALVLMDQALRHRAQCGDVGEVTPRIAAAPATVSTPRRKESGKPGRAQPAKGPASKAQPARTGRETTRKVTPKTPATGSKAGKPRTKR